MEAQDAPSFYYSPSRTPTLRDLVAVVFRHGGLIVLSFLAVLCVVVLGTWMLPKQYEAQMKILVKRERVDAIVTSDSNLQSWGMREISQEELNSEVELLRSRDLLEKVVVSCGLENMETSSLFARFFGGGRPSQDMLIPVAVRTLERALQVEPVAKSKLIEVRYTARDPRLAAKVLQTLAAGYMDKHLSVHRPPGALDFFQQQTNQYKKGLTEAEQQLAEFSRNSNVVSIDLEKDIMLRKLSDFETQLRETQAAEAAVDERIKSLESQSSATPSRVVTQVRTSDNAILLQQLKTTLLNLELKRTELLSKYEPGYRTVQEIDTQIAQTKQALEQAESKAVRDETTDLDRTRLWLDEELARARAELATLKARSAELAKSVEEYRERAQEFSRKEMEHQDLLRAAKTAEENYLLYLRKQEEARISDALDRKQILNVAIAEAATVPAFPSSPRWGLHLIVGFVLALLTSFFLVFAVDHVDPSFRTPDEVERYLGMPVLAAMPRAEWELESGYSPLSAEEHVPELLQSE